MTVEQLLADAMVYRARWVSITGGEPLMHNVYPLINELLCSDDKRGVHVETSGTIMFDRSQVHQKYTTDRLWLTVSPKHHTLEGMLRQADEIRVMVDRSFTEENFLAVFGKYIDSGKLWISPVNDLVSLNYDNLQTCLALQHKYRQLRLTTQLHKQWNLR
jgi:organic radical activating enzyme